MLSAGLKHHIIVCRHDIKIVFVLYMHDTLVIPLHAKEAIYP